MAQLGADVEALRLLASKIHTNAGRLRVSRSSLTATVRAVSWTGPDADRFRGEWVSHSATLRSSADRLVEIARELDRQVSQQVEASSSEGLVLVSARGGAAPVIPTTGRHGDPPMIDLGDREDRRVANDERARIPAGGRDRDDPGMHVENDWAGRSILERYLSGGDDWTINDDPQWNDYMRANQSLTDALNPRTEELAQRLYAQVTQGGDSRARFDDTFAMEIENGEGMVGYQYLHGTNADVGGFRMSGDATITRTADGGYDVRVAADYTWNDVIDPNGQYVTDRAKSAFAEIATLGRADPYDLHITWPGQTVIHLDATGNVVSATGYPSR